MSVALDTGIFVFVWVKECVCRIMWCLLGASTVGVMWRKRLSERVCHVHCVDAIPVRPNACMYLYLSERCVRFKPAELEIRDPSASANYIRLTFHVLSVPLLGLLRLQCKTISFSVND